MTEFTVTIEMGNDAMCHGRHVAAILRELAKKVQTLGLSCANGGTLQDINGNTVAHWDVK